MRGASVPNAVSWFGSHNVPVRELLGEDHLSPRRQARHFEGIHTTSNLDNNQLRRETTIEISNIHPSIGCRKHTTNNSGSGS
jgi:hypothetical protein